MYISLASILGYPVQEKFQSEKGVFSSDDFLSDLRASAQHWAANMSSEGVRPAEALSTDSAIVGLVYIISVYIRLSCSRKIPK